MKTQNQYTVMWIYTGHEKIARLLIHNGADFTIKNKDGKSASELAKEKGIACFSVFFLSQVRLRLEFN